MVLFYEFAYYAAFLGTNSSSLIRRCAKQESNDWRLIHKKASRHQNPRQMGRRQGLPRHLVGGLLGTHLKLSRHGGQIP